MNYIDDDNDILNLELYLYGTSDEKYQFVNSLINRFYKYGFLYLKIPESFSAMEDLYHLTSFQAEYLHLFIKALAEHPFLRLYMNAPDCDMGGYNTVFFPESTNECNIDQPIESIVSLPLVWKWSKKIHLPNGIQNFLIASELAYNKIYEVSSILIDAFEKGYNKKENSLKSLFTKRNNGSIRFIKYHQPNSTDNCNTDIVTEPTIPHIDKSFLSFTLGETSSGLYQILNNGKEVIVSTKFDCLLVTSGAFAAELTSDESYPMMPFKHTVKNKNERIVGLVFVAPDF